MEYKAVCSGDFPAHIISHPFVLPGCDLKLFHDEKYRTLIFWIVPVLSVVSNLSIYGYALGMDVNMEVIVSILMGGIFILLGNYMSKNHQNYTVGIKLPWTLNSEENWNRTHRMAGKLWILAGLVFWGSVFFENNMVPIVIIVVVVTIPMIYSFVLYKKGI